MINLAICDDDITFSNDFHNRLKRVFSDKNLEINIIVFEKGSDFISSEHIFDVVFLDIEMPEFDGFNIAEKLNEKNTDTLIVFVSMHKNYVFNSFDYNPFSFLRKEKIEQDLEPLAERIYKKLKKDRLIYFAEESRGLNFSDIFFIEVIRNSLIIYTLNEHFTIRKTLAAIEEELKDSDFVRCHRSFLINISQISKIEKSDIIMSNNKNIPLSRSYRKEVNDKFHNYLRRKI
ncbi:MAG: LytTR family DNA-binding domain-containing protein [Oscillospiraceae bacterium]|jgi:DNA-binding LytR/AlgR family response regulator|nr:LytTR family DNA-binding domain-containing protein [Oscillospiraceae bacterium]